MIRALRAFLGADRLDAAIRVYRTEWGTRGGIRSMRLHDKQPLLDAFENFERRTACGRKLKRLTPDLSDLAHVAALAKAVVPTLDERVAEQHRSSLLSLEGQLKPLLLEWKTAAQLIRTHKAELAWISSGRGRAPEFIARASGVEVEIECKYQTSMVGQILGEAEADRLAQEILERISTQGLYGDLELDVPAEGIQIDDAIIAAVRRTLDEQLCLGSVDVVLPGCGSLRGKLKAQDERLISQRQWRRELEGLKSTRAYVRAYGRAKSHGDDRLSSPIALSVMARVKTAQELATDLWEKRFRKAAMQCTGCRGAILVFEWERIEDPHLFAAQNILSALIDRVLSDFPHVARVVMRCRSDPVRYNGMVSYEAKAFSRDNPSPVYPEVLDFLQLDAPLGAASLPA